MAASRSAPAGARIDAGSTAELAELERACDALARAGVPVPPVLLDRIARLRVELSTTGSAELPSPVPVASTPPVGPPPAAPVTLSVGHQSGGVTAGVVQGDVHVQLGEDRSERHAAALHAYRGWVATGCERVTMRLLAPEQNDASQPDHTPELARVYVALDTTTTEQEEPGKIDAGSPEEAESVMGLRSEPSGQRDTASRRLSVLEVMARQPKLVLLGQPGFGKSTLVQHTALCLARDGGAPEAGWERLVAGLGCRGIHVLPVVLVLRDLAASLPGKPEKQPAPSAALLRDFLEARLREAGLDEAIEPFWAELNAGRAIILLDGLDEVPTLEGRRFLRAVVEAFEQRYPRCRYVVTCRVLTWAQEKLALRGFVTAEIASFDEAKIAAFIEAWHAELLRLGRIDAATAARLGPKLREAIRGRTGLATLAQNPLLLTVMAVVHTKGGELPEGEAPLYREAVEVLLWRWQDTVSALSPKKVLAEVGAREVDLLEALRRLAFTVHGSTPAADRRGRAHEAGAADAAGGVHDGVADIAESALLEALMALDPNESRQWARRLVDALKTRAGLLVERAPQLYTFPHRTFQELLAGWHLALQRDFEVQAAQLLRADATRWRKAVLLAAGLLAAEPRLGELKALLDELCPSREEDTESAWREAWWAGEVVEVVGPRRLGRLRAELALVGRVRGRLRALVEGGKLAPRERVEAGRLLGRIGDPRFREDAWGLPADDFLGFVRIPAGPFWMGSDKAVDEEAEGDELPQHQVTLPEVWIARYPVTIGQWRAFVHASAFTPGDMDSLEGVDNEPVRWVSWREAVAFARWLDGVLRAWVECPAQIQALLAAGYRVTLPSEAEWEKAARGTEGRIWPWGNTFENERANSGYLGVGGVSPAGCFPSGATPEGVQDMAGNVWEWTRSSISKYPYVFSDGREDMSKQESGRILRGGSFRNPRRSVRCASRLDDVPGPRRGNVGFRLLLSPF